MCRWSQIVQSFQECDQNKHLTSLCISNSFNFNVQSHNNINKCIINMCYIFGHVLYKIH